MEKQSLKRRFKMIVYNHAVIVWTKDGKGKIFNDIQKADKYYQACEYAKKEPIWQRIEQRKV